MPRPRNAPAAPVGQEQLRRWAIDALTEALAGKDPDGYRVDGAEIIAIVLASVAANLGGIDEVLAGRSGSWEAGHVHDLLTGTIGDDSTTDGWHRLLTYRTRPVLVGLHVAELVAHHLDRPGCDHALLTVPDPRDFHVTVNDPPVLIGNPAVPQHRQDQQAAYDRDLERVQAAFTAAHARYALDFARAVHTRAATLLPPDVPVLVLTDTTHACPCCHTALRRHGPPLAHCPPRHGSDRLARDLFTDAVAALDYPATPRTFTDLTTTQANQ